MTRKLFKQKLQLEPGQFLGKQEFSSDSEVEDEHVEGAATEGQLKSSAVQVAKINTEDIEAREDSGADDEFADVDRAIAEKLAGSMTEVSTIADEDDANYAFFKEADAGFDWDRLDRQYEAREREEKEAERLRILKEEEDARRRRAEEEEAARLRREAEAEEAEARRLQAQIEEAAAARARYENRPRGEILDMELVTYVVTQGVILNKRSEDPSTLEITKMTRPVGHRVPCTGRHWHAGPGGALWAEVDVPRAAGEFGWLLVEGELGRAFDAEGPLLVDAAAGNAVTVSLQIRHAGVVIYTALLPTGYSIEKVIKAMASKTKLQWQRCILTRCLPPKNPDTGIRMGFDAMAKKDVLKNRDVVGELDLREPLNLVYTGKFENDYLGGQDPFNVATLGKVENLADLGRVDNAHLKGRSFNGSDD